MHGTNPYGSSTPNPYYGYPPININIAPTTVNFYPPMQPAYYSEPPYAYQDEVEEKSTAVATRIIQQPQAASNKRSHEQITSSAPPQPKQITALPQTAPKKPAAEQLPSEPKSPILFARKESKPIVRGQALQNPTSNFPNLFHAIEPVPFPTPLTKHGKVMNGNFTGDFLYDKVKFAGTLVNGQREGVGKMQWAQKNESIWFPGAEYDGDWLNGVRSGHGTYTNVQAISSNTNFNKILPCAPGVEKHLVFSYQGAWKDDVPHGFGVTTFLKGTSLRYLDLVVVKHSGFYSQGTPHGEGELTCKDKSVYSGKWEFGHCTSLNRKTIDTHLLTQPTTITTPRSEKEPDTKRARTEEE